MATLKLRPQARRKLRNLAPQVATDTGLAKLLEVDRTTLHRITTGDTDPSSRFIAGVVNAFGPECFADLFKAVPDKRKA